MRAQLTEQCVIRANAQFWEQMLAMTLEPAGPGEELKLAAPHAFGSVGLSGAWTGRVEVRMAESLAREATAAMLMVPLEQVGETDTIDASREIANIIAGVIKSCLPRPCAMALPEVALEAAEFEYRPGASDAIHVIFLHPTGKLIVRVWEQECLA